MDLLQNFWRRIFAEVASSSGDMGPSDSMFSSETCQVHIASEGVGNAVSIAVNIKNRIVAGKRQIIAVVVGSTPAASEFYQNLAFIDGVFVIPKRLFADLIGGPAGKWPTLLSGVGREAHDYLWEVLLNITLDDKPLYLSREDLRHQKLSVPVPEKYVVFQPITTTFKNLKLHYSELMVALEDRFNLPVVLIGSEMDRVHLDALPKKGHDYVGKLSIPEVIWLIANSVGVVGTESWSPLMGAALGIPSIIFLGKGTHRVYQEKFHTAWPELSCLCVDQPSVHVVHTNIPYEQAWKIMEKWGT